MACYRITTAIGVVEFLGIQLSEVFQRQAAGRLHFYLTRSWLFQRTLMCATKTKLCILPFSLIISSQTHLSVSQGLTTVVIRRAVHAPRNSAGMAGGTCNCHRGALPTECFYTHDAGKAENGCEKVKKGSARIDEVKQMSKDFLSTHEVR